MNILHISVYPEKGQTYTKKSGVASYLKNLLTSKKTDHNMTVLCDQDGSGDSYDEDGLHIIRGWKPGLSSIVDIVKYVWKHKTNYEVIHIQHELHFWGSMIVGYLVLFLPFLSKNTKWIMTSHHAIDYDAIDTQFVANHGQKLPVRVVRLGFRVLYMLYHLRDQVIVHEEVHTTRLTKQYGLPSSKLQVIAHGVENIKPLDKLESKQKLGISQNMKVIFTMGYVTGYKDLAVLIRGYAHWVKDNPNSILIIGSGPEKKSMDNSEYMAYYQSIQDLAAQLIPQHNYTWLGFVASENIPLYYSASDVVVLPYRYTLSASGPMAIAIAYERPFLASRCFEDYFPDFQECIFDMDEQSLSICLSQFYESEGKFNNWIEGIKKQRLYSVCLIKTIALY